MITVGIPKIIPYEKPKKLSKWQKYLLGKRDYDKIVLDNYHSTTKFKDLPKNIQNEWIRLATMKF